MKIKPIVEALEDIGAKVDLVHTGQHYDPMMSDVFFEDLGLKDPDYHLGVGSGSHGEQTAQVMIGFESLVAAQNYQAVVVVGDVNPTLACAIVAAKAGLLVAHVEAGLRSRDWDMPEEINRVATDRLSHLLFAPSPDAVENLVQEGYRPDQIHLVGNVMIDTLMANLSRARQQHIAKRLGLGDDPYGVVTLHRPSNVDDPGRLSSLVEALEEIALRLPLVFSVHPRTRQLLTDRSVSSSIHFTKPLGYLDFLDLQAGSTMVLTDSGGIQEETTALGVPCLTLRANTERPITITEGTNQLVGVDPERIVQAANEILTGRVPEQRCPRLWDGKAAIRIARALEAALATPDRRNPTDLVNPLSTARL